MRRGERWPRALRNGHDQASQLHTNTVHVCKELLNALNCSPESTLPSFAGVERLRGERLSLWGQVQQAPLPLSTCQSTTTMSRRVCCHMIPTAVLHNHICTSGCSGASRRCFSASDAHICLIPLGHTHAGYHIVYVCRCMSRGLSRIQCTGTWTAPTTWQCLTEAWVQLRRSATGPSGPPWDLAQSACNPC